MADVGAPDGANASLVYRPLGAVRLQAGMGHNMISTGGRVGVTLIPLKSWFTPTLSFDVGRYGEGDANEVVQQVSGDPMFSSSFLNKVGYSYANAHLGLELGRKTVTFYLNVGASRVDAELSGATAMGSTQTTTSAPVRCRSTSTSKDACPATSGRSTSTSCSPPSSRTRSTRATSHGRSHANAPNGASSGASVTMFMKVLSV